MRSSGGVNVRFHFACASVRKHLLLQARVWRKQKQLSAEEIERMATVYREFKHDHVPDAVRAEAVVLCRFPNVTKSLP
jgi:hypothetical protein